MTARRQRAAAALAALVLSATAGAHDGPATARYLANEGVMVVHGETRVLFDPLFNESFGQYRLLPETMRRALLDGEPPFDGIDAVFVSHYHDDHFAPADLLEYLEAQPSVRLYAPGQAVDALREAAAGDSAVFARVTAVRLDDGDAPLTFSQPGLTVEVLRIAHSGWPMRHEDVENLAWRVTPDGGPTVLHLGDADTRELHFRRDEEFWEERPTALALPPYWFFLSDSGLGVLEELLRPALAVGIHVPVSVPANPAERDEALRDVDLFTEPGETRDIPERD